MKKVSVLEINLLYRSKSFRVWRTSQLAYEVVNLKTNLIFYFSDRQVEFDNPKDDFNDWQPYDEPEPDLNILEKKHRNMLHVMSGVRSQSFLTLTGWTSTKETGVWQ